MSSRMFCSLVCAALVLSRVSLAQPSPMPPQGTPIAIESKVFNERYGAVVYLPEEYQESSRRYPVVYLLDGEYYSTMACEAVRTLNHSDRIPPCIVVGVLTSHRERDFTPQGGAEWKAPKEMKDAGGADAFLQYLETELIPRVDSLYRTHPYRVVVGHSLGGLLAIHAFSTRPKLFQAYIALESSLWWNDGSAGTAMIDFLNDHPDYQGKLFLGRIQMPRSFWFPINVTVVDYLETKHPSGLEYTYMEFEKETHSTMIYPGLYYGIRDIFSDYAIELTDTTSAGSVTAHYKRLSEKYGYPVPMPQQTYNFLVDISMHQKKYDEALAYGDRWIKEYARSSRAQMEIGKVYLEMGKPQQARSYLSRSVELNVSNDMAKQLLNDIEKN